jgi:hypothetical protein
VPVPQEQEAKELEELCGTFTVQASEDHSDVDDEPSEKKAC